MATPTPPRGIILFAHGSRDPLWRKPIEAVAQRLLDADSGVLVRCAYLELDTPDLLVAAAELATAGCTELTIVPMFLGTGRHAREDLPGLVAAVRAAHLRMAVTLQQAVGEDGRVLDLLARIAMETPRGNP
ncbi:MAG TPA: CbiX/SirB N-terminal domain-containing protein [Ramlibacter sp.]|nr:CbiX/SirB N-terminal domain-containing protein [Ramlibacter sp.]